MSGVADRLYRARRDHTTVDPTDVPEPRSMDDAYALQAAIVERIGAPIGGFKVGSTSREAQRLLGTDEPGSSPVPVPYVHHSPGRVAIVPAHMPALEGEFAFRLGRALPARRDAYGRDDVIDAIDAVAGAVEVVGTRIKGGLAGKGRYLVTADCGANIALVLGPWTTAWRDLDLPTHAVGVSVNGAAKGRGTGARALDDPINVMVWLANHQSRRGLGLDAGMFVSTGTCTGLDPVAPGDRVTADFGALGQIDIDFTDALA